MIAGKLIENAYFITFWEYFWFKREKAITETVIEDKIKWLNQNLKKLLKVSKYIGQKLSRDNFYCKNSQMTENISLNWKAVTLQITFWDVKHVTLWITFLILKEQRNF